EHFRLVAGRDLVTEYESSPGKFRAFCARCGSPILARWAAHPDFVRIRLGTLDDDPGTRPLLHVWVGSKAPWFEITDELPRLQGVASRAARRSGSARPGARRARSRSALRGSPTEFVRDAWSAQHSTTAAGRVTGRAGSPAVQAFLDKRPPHFR